MTMFIEKEPWIRRQILKLACFFTGRNYRLLRECSEASAKTTLRYFGAMLIVMTIWAIVGFLFGQRYLHFTPQQALIMGAVTAFIVALVERYIIMGTRNLKMAFTRLGLGVIMALLGSLILDQIIFKEDIEKKKIETIHEEVARILPQKTRELQLQIANLEKVIAEKEKEAEMLKEDIAKRPMRVVYATKQDYTIDSTGKRIPVGRTVQTQQIPNPNIERLKQVEAQINELMDRKARLEAQLISTKDDLEKELLSKVGFLDELTVLTRLLLSSRVALIAWILLFLFFLSLELLVVLGKFLEKTDDYDAIIEFQRKTKIATLEGEAPNDLKGSTSSSTSNGSTST